MANIFDLLAHLAFSLDSAQLDHLFTLFQSSLGSGNTERLLEFVQRLATDDSEGKLAVKVCPALLNKDTSIVYIRISCIFQYLSFAPTIVSRQNQQSNNIWHIRRRYRADNAGAEPPVVHGA